MQSGPWEGAGAASCGSVRIAAADANDDDGGDGDVVIEFFGRWDKGG